MDEVTLLRDFEPASPLDADVRARARTALEAVMHDPAAAARGRRSPLARMPRRTVGGILAVGLAAVLVGVLSIGFVTAGPSPRANAEAARLLAGAADAASSRADTDAKYRALVIHSAGLVMDGVSGDRPVAAAFLELGTSTLKIPTGDGIWTLTEVGQAPTTFFGGAAGRSFADEVRRSGGNSDEPLTFRSQNGHFTYLHGPLGTSLWNNPARLARLPRSTTALLQLLRGPDDDQFTHTQAQRVVAHAAQVLRSGAADPALQAAIFEALRQQTGVTVLGHTTDLLGRAGTAIGAASLPGDAFQSTLILGNSGHYLGERTVLLRPTGVVPAGTASYATAVEERGTM